MIRFFCKCSFEFVLPDDMAGGAVQCPRCKLLHDVPTLGELPHLEADGTFKLDDEPPRAADPVSELDYYSSQDGTPTTRVERDLRPTMEDIRRVGDDQQAQFQDDVELAQPRYDPETGELVRPMKLQTPTEPQPAIPVIKPALHYEAPQTRQIEATTTALLSLFRPINLVVMFFILLLHLMVAGLLVLMSFYYLVVSVGVLMLAIAIVAHYVNVIDEIGPAERDELPRPLRNVNWGEDVFSPFAQFLLAFGISYAPWAISQFTGLDAISPPLQTILSWLMLAVGTLVFPAALLTTATSGSFTNLRPDYLLRVMRLIGGKYLMAVLFWIITAPLYAGSAWLLTRPLFLGRSRGATFPLAYACAGLIAAIVLAHWFSMLLGLFFRRHIADFPWPFFRPRVRRTEILKKGT